MYEVRGIVWWVQRHRGAIVKEELEDGWIMGEMWMWSIGLYESRGFWFRVVKLLPLC